MQSTILILAVISMVFTIGIMFAGVFTMTKQEPDGRKSNKMMRLRVLSQFITIVLIVLYIWVRSQA